MSGDFGVRSVPPCGDCWENGHCSMNCGPSIVRVNPQPLKLTAKGRNKVKGIRGEPARYVFIDEISGFTEKQFKRLSETLLDMPLLGDFTD